MPYQLKLPIAIRLVGDKPTLLLGDNPIPPNETISLTADDIARALHWHWQDGVRKGHDLAHSEYDAKVHGDEKGPDASDGG